MTETQQTNSDFWGNDATDTIHLNVNLLQAEQKKTDGKCDFFDPGTYYEKNNIATPEKKQNITPQKQNCHPQHVPSPPKNTKKQANKHMHKSISKGSNTYDDNYDYDNYEDYDD